MFVLGLKGFGALFFMKICRRCGGKAHKSHAPGFLGRVVLRRLGLRAFHCPNCNTYFYRFPGNGASSEPEDLSESPFFRKPGDNADSFRKLLAEIHQAEQRTDLSPRRPEPEVESNQSQDSGRQQKLTFEPPSRLKDLTELRQAPAPKPGKRLEDLAALREQDQGPSVAKPRIN